MAVNTTVIMLSGLLGTAAGVLTPHIAHRLSVTWDEPPRTGCAGCARPFPAGIRGWVRPTARCAACGLRQGPGHWWTIPVGACAAMLIVASTTGPPPARAAGLALAVIGLLLAAVDIAVLRLPDPLVATAALLTLYLLAVAAWEGGDWTPYGRALLGGAALLVSYGVLWFLSRGQVGFGDVKLAGVLGIFLGWHGWGAVLAGAVAAVALNGLLAVFLLASRRTRLAAYVPMGPSLLAGALLALLM